jgi:hypothetical protein
MRGFLEALATTFPECELSQKALQRFCRDVVGDEPLEQLACTEWLRHLAAPLSSDAAPYVSPLQRILAREGAGTPLVYHAVAYKDGSTVLKHQIPLISALDLNSKWHDPSFHNSRSVMVSYIVHITNKCLEYCHVVGLGPAPRVPSREELDEEIQRHADAQRSGLPQDTGALQVTSAFTDTFQALVDMFAVSTSDATSEEYDLREEWETLAANARFQKMCQDNDDQAITCLETTTIPAFADAANKFSNMSEQQRTDVWCLLNNLNAYNMFSNLMPSNLKNRIEKVAQNLAAEISNGSMSLESFSTMDKLVELGNTVVKDTTPQDMEAMASQMGKLLPAVHKMASSNPFLSQLSKQTGLDSMLANINASTYQG